MVSRSASARNSKTRVQTEDKGKKSASTTKVTEKKQTGNSRKRGLENDDENGQTPTSSQDPVNKKTKLTEEPNGDVSIFPDFGNLPTGVALTVGQGDMGQLGLGEDIMSRKKPAIVANIADEKVKRVVAGGMHTVCLTDQHKIYTFGCNDEFALGRETADDDSEYEPKLIVGPLTERRVVHISAGDSHTCALTDGGKVFVWGSFRDGRGVIGLIKEEEVCKCPTQLTSINETVVDVDSGNDHLVMVTMSGKVFTMGCPDQGQIGRIGRYFTDRGRKRKTEENKERNNKESSKRSTRANYITPAKIHLRKVRGSKKPVIVKVFCGSYTTWVLSSEGHIFGFGLNNYKQLGFPDGENRYIPEYVETLSDIGCKQIAGGQHHTLVLDHKGSVYTIGRGDYGRLGHGSDVIEASEPKKINSLCDITSITATSCVSFAVDKDGKAYGWGLGTNLQLTTGDEEDEWEPVGLTGKNLEKRSVLQVASGGQHTVILAQDNAES
ncbi:regulator of chromosome condensation isoform X2 [Ciona intestinalis]